MLPEQFLIRMKSNLNDKYSDYISAMSEKSVKAIRINSSKISDEDFLKSFPYETSKIGEHEYLLNLDEEDRIGNTSLHHAGAFYSQEPSAMKPVNCVEFKDNFLVLDTCASPGGKSIQAAMNIPNGVIISNEYITSRATTLMGNIERMGIPNAIVTNTDTETLSKWFSSVFDVVICDAPCSGEGMFRKNPEAISEWSMENVELCAKRQNEILNNVCSTVKNGGVLVYSTCTFSKEENEYMVKLFLDNHPDFELIDVPQSIKDVTVPGIDLPLTRRFYPFSGKGEGQFMAIMKRTTSDLPNFGYKDSSKDLSKQDYAIVKKFIEDNTSIVDYTLKQIKDTIYISPDFPIPPHSIFTAGVKLGTIEKGRIVPHHQLFTALGKYFNNKLFLDSNSDYVRKYIEGNVIPSNTDDGWTAVFCDGCTIGGGKTVSKTLKNHYPKGLRKNIN